MVVIRMKNKKRVLTILLVLIILIAVLLSIVLVFGGLREKEINKYHQTLEDAACKLAKKENYTEEICEAFGYLCEVHNDKLIAREFIKGNLVNPLTGKKASEDTNNYVKITWKDNKMKCTYKEG